MKNYFFLGLLSISIFPSCKKDRVCICTITNISAGITVTSTNTITYKKISKSAAEDVCSRYSDSNVGSNGNNESYTSGCELK